MPAFPLVSVIVPVRNGEGRIEHCLASLAAQSYPREAVELLVVDGASTDRTVALAEAGGARVIASPGTTVAVGRNAGFEEARGEFVAFTDDDCVLPPGWIEAGLAALADGRADGVGGPTPLPETATSFSRACELLFRLAMGLGYSVQAAGNLAAEVDDLPGGNAMYRRSALEPYMPLPADMLTAEDVELHLRMRADGRRLVWSKDFAAAHHKRDSPLGFFRQIRRFAIGRVQLGRRHRKGFRPLHEAAAWLFPAGGGLLLMAGTLSPVLPFAMLGAGAGACVLVAILLTHRLAPSLCFPLVVALFLVAWSLGVFGERLLPLADPRGR